MLSPTFAFPLSCYSLWLHASRENDKGPTMWLLRLSEGYKESDRQSNRPATSMSYYFSLLLEILLSRASSLSS
jgi:hypothetical protein